MMHEQLGAYVVLHSYAVVMKAHSLAGAIHACMHASKKKGSYGKEGCVLRLRFSLYRVARVGRRVMNVMTF